MTANAFAEDIRAAEEAGMNGHIAKPIDIQVMIKTITNVLKGR
jgi:CheY-like chemotaxis protein